MYWKERDFFENKKYNDGECTGMKHDDNVEFIVEAGWNGGFVSEIVTVREFFCANWEKK
jgi:hypothetical protein